MRKSRSIRSFSGLVSILIAASILIGCAPGQPTTAPETVPSESPTPLVSEPPYQIFEVPGPERAKFELPVGWDFWGNGGWLSPNNGQTFAGLRVTLIKPGQDAGRRLFNEDAVILDESIRTLDQIEMTRYEVISYITNASTMQRSLDGYELIYAFPGNEPDVLAGVFVRTASLDELKTLEPILEHMAVSVEWVE